MQNKLIAIKESVLTLQRNEKPIAIYFHDISRRAQIMYKLVECRIGDIEEIINNNEEI